MNPMNDSIPQNIPQYLMQVRAALAGADPAVVQDALYDAEEHLRAELAANPGVGEAELLRRIATSYGSPEEVAAIYRDTEVTVTRALRTPLPPARPSVAGRFFGVIADPRTYGALFYMLLALVTGMFYFTWSVAGISLSAGLAILIIGVPFVVLFIGTVRVLSLVEGRIVETLLGVRMPRRPAYVQRGMPLRTRIGLMFSDPRTWSTLLYFLLMLPLGVLYFALAACGLSLSLGLIVAPLASLFVDGMHSGIYLDGTQVIPVGIAVPAAFLLGVLMLFLTLHLARAIGLLHGRIAHHLLVKSSTAGEVEAAATATAPPGAAAPAGVTAATVS
jgi:uncharacterized membrane protein